MSADTLFSQWRVVNEQANEAERRLFEQSLTYLRGEGAPPSDTARVNAAQLRNEARLLFARALKQVDDGAAAARQGMFRAPSQPGSSSSGKA